MSFRGGGYQLSKGFLTKLSWLQPEKSRRWDPGLTAPCEAPHLRALRALWPGLKGSKGCPVARAKPAQLHNSTGRDSSKKGAVPAPALRSLSVSWRFRYSITYNALKFKLHFRSTGAKSAAALDDFMIDSGTCRSIGLISHSLRKTVTADRRASL